MADGGDATYLCHWMRKSDLADLPPVNGRRKLISCRHLKIDHFWSFGSGLV
jgi:hypothetical protein